MAPSELPPRAPSPSDEAQPLTELLCRAAAGEREAADSAMPLVYQHLRRIAQAHMAGERRDHTLQATALVHETWLKLVGIADPRWPDRTAFYEAAATAMRRILVDHARRRSRQKRGAGASPERDAIGSIAAQPDLVDATTFLQLDDLIVRLEAEDPRCGRIVRLRFFAGLGIDETAAALGMSRRTVLREWSWAKARLYAALRDEADHD
jgi:RNA polymerase sigma factor (TIGR02999 family)